VAQTNLDLVRSIYAAWERGDFASAEWADPDIELAFADGPTAGSSKGLASMAAAASELFSAWEGVRVAVDDYRELDDERVLVLDRRAGRGKTSGLELGQMRTQGATLWHARNGKVTKLVVYWDRDRALADLGLAPEDGSP
jgi:ketosteroid isomerase-like protein